MNLHELWENTYEILGIIGTVMGVFGLPSVAVLYNRALKKQIEFSPALAYAYTYFNNFITPLHDRFVSGKQLTVDGFAIDKVFVRMPRTLTDVSNNRLKAIKLELENQNAPVKEVAVQTPSGKRTVLFRCKPDERIAFDIPRILSSMEPIIAEHVGAPRTQKSSTWSKVETREIDHFCKHIRRLIKQNGYQQRVKVFNCEVHDLTAEVDDLEPPPPARWYARVWQRMTSWLRRDDP